VPWTAQFQPQPQAGHASWFHDFQAQQQFPGMPQGEQMQSQPRFGVPMGYEMQRPVGYMPPVLRAEESLESRWKGKWRAREDEHIDATALEAEFEAQASELLRQDTEQHAEVGHDVLMSTGGEAQEEVTLQHGLQQDHLSMPAHWDRPRDMSREAPEPEQEQAPHQPPATDDDLADAAGQLLERMADNQTQKFKDSDFMALMRQLRDREVRVEGNELVDNAAVSVSTIPEAQSRLPGHDHNGPADHVTCRVFGCEMGSVG